MVKLQVSKELTQNFWKQDHLSWAFTLLRFLSKFGKRVCTKMLENEADIPTSEVSKQGQLISYWLPLSVAHHGWGTKKIFSLRQSRMARKSISDASDSVNWWKHLCGYMYIYMHCPYAWLLDIYCLLVTNLPTVFFFWGKMYKNAGASLFWGTSSYC